MTRRPDGVTRGKREQPERLSEKTSNRRSNSPNREYKGSHGEEVEAPFPPRNRSVGVEPESNRNDKSGTISLVVVRKPMINIKDT